MNKTKEWIAELIESGKLCEDYTQKARSCRSRYDLFKLATDVNGARYLCETRKRGYGLPYDVIESEFAHFINGKCEAEHPSKTYGSYSSALYIGIKDGLVESKCSLLIFLNWKGKVTIPAYSFVHIYADMNSEVTIDCPDTSICKVESWGAKIFSNDNVKIKYFE